MRKASRRLLVLGFGGTLVPHNSRNPKLFPKLPPALLGNLQVIAEDADTQVVVVSALARNQLAQTLASVPCWVIAEGGVCYREPGEEEWHSCVEAHNTEWLGPVKEIMEYFAARTPGSKVDLMESSVSWLYQNTQGDHAAIQSKDLLIHLWAGPLLSAPAEVVVEKDCVNVRPTGIGKAQQLERILAMIYGDDRPVSSLEGDTLVLCIGDFIMRDEDIFVTVQKFFEPEGSERYKSVSPSFGPDVDLWDGQAIADREPHWTEDVNLEANSMSLGTGFNLLSERKGGDDGPFGLHNSSFGDATPLLKKVPSEPDLPVYEADSPPNEAQSCGPGDDSGGPPAIFTCTVSRKATRAKNHLSDTNDVAFLIAKLARELRQAKQVTE